MQINLPLPTPPTRPYDPITRPWYLDSFWGFFLGRPFAYAAQNGNGGTQGTVTTNTLSIAAGGATTWTLQAGQGANYVVGEPVGIGQNFAYESHVVNSIAVDALNVSPAVIQGGGFPIGTPVFPLWSNDTHTGSTPANSALAQFIANAKQSTYVNGTTCMPLSGGNDIGQFEGALAADGNGVNVPPGWVSVNPTKISSTAQTSYAVTTIQPDAITTNSFKLITLNTDTGGTGIQTVNALAVVPGQCFTLTANMKGLVSGAFRLSVIDSDSSVVLATQTDSAGGTAGQHYFNLGIPSVVQFKIPQGTANIKIRILSVASAGVVATLYVDNVRLKLARQDANNDRYVIENPGNRPIVVLGDSWTSLTYSGSYFPQLVAALQNRLGTGVQVISAGKDGNTMQTMMLRFAAEVQAVNPAYCILGSGLVNDTVNNVAPATTQTYFDQFIDQCRSNGIIPVIPGVAPCSNAAITGGLLTCHDLNDTLKARCDRFDL